MLEIIHQTRNTVFEHISENRVENTRRSGIDPLHKWRLNLNNNTWYILSLVFMFQDRNFHMNVRLRMYEYCYSNLGAIYVKGL